MMSYKPHRLHSTLSVFALTGLFSSQSLATQFQIVDAKGSPAKGVVVYAHTVPAPTPSVRSPNASVIQKEKSFIPALVVSQANQDVQFINQDDITHHIYSVGEQNGFSFKIRAGVDDKKHQFTHTGQVSMGCNIHDWMSGYLYVVDTPYFGISDDNGNIELDIPAVQSLTLNVWHPNLDRGTAQAFPSLSVTDKTIKVAINGSYTPLEVVKPQTDFDFLDDYE